MRSLLQAGLEGAGAWRLAVAQWGAVTAVPVRQQAKVKLVVMVPAGRTKQDLPRAKISVSCLFGEPALMNAVIKQVIEGFYFARLLAKENLCPSGKRLDIRVLRECLDDPPCETILSCNTKAVQA